jgi:hypothetical protein
MMSKRSSKSVGTPWAALISSVPRIVQIPQFEANITMGDIVDSRALFK